MVLGTDLGRLNFAIADLMPGTRNVDYSALCYSIRIAVALTECVHIARRSEVRVLR